MAGSGALVEVARRQTVRQLGKIQFPELARQHVDRALLALQHAHRLGDIVRAHASKAQTRQLRAICAVEFNDALEAIVPRHHFRT